MNAPRAAAAFITMAALSGPASAKEIDYHHEKTEGVTSFQVEKFMETAGAGGSDYDRAATSIETARREALVVDDDARLQAETQWAQQKHDELVRRRDEIEAKLQALYNAAAIDEDYILRFAQVRGDIYRLQVLVEGYGATSGVVRHRSDAILDGQLQVTDDYTIVTDRMRALLTGVDLGKVQVPSGEEGLRLQNYVTNHWDLPDPYRGDGTIPSAGRMNPAVAEVDMGLGVDGYLTREEQEEMAKGKRDRKKEAASADFARLREAVRQTMDEWATYRSSGSEDKYGSVGLDTIITGYARYAAADLALLEALGAVCSEGASAAQGETRERLEMSGVAGRVFVDKDQRRECREPYCPRY